MITAGTGHRPEKLRGTEDELRALIAKGLRDTATTTFISGMASGYDLIAGSTALRLGIEVWAAKPWTAHGPRITDSSLYSEVLEGASRVIAVVDAVDYPGPWVYQKRNEWMVDNAHRVMAYWDGSSGGTRNCIVYANRKGTPVRNLYVEQA